MKAKYSIPILLAALLIFLVSIGVSRSIIMNDKAEMVRDNFISSLQEGDVDGLTSYLYCKNNEEAKEFFKQLPEEIRKDMANFMACAELHEEGLDTRIYLCQKGDGPEITYKMKFIKGNWYIISNDYL